jgi:hypothetical protein
LWTCDSKKCFLFSRENRLGMRLAARSQIRLQLGLLGRYFLLSPATHHHTTQENIHDISGKIQDRLQLRCKRAIQFCG